jgi:tRNA-specific 2-thiouridylase
MAGRTPYPLRQMQYGGEVHRPVCSWRGTLGADCLATGHYVRRVVGADRRAAAPPRGRSRRATRAISCSRPRRTQLDYLRFPLGRIAQAVRCARSRRRLGLAVAMKPDSQDICFVPRRRLCLGRAQAAPRRGRRRRDRGCGWPLCWAGTRGMIHFTVGQRKGLELGGQPGSALCGPAGCGGASRVIVGTERHALAVGRGAALSDINWLGGDFAQGR